MMLKATSLLETAIALSIVTTCITVGSLMFLQFNNSGVVSEQLKVETLFDNWALYQLQTNVRSEMLIFEDPDYSIRIIDDTSNFQTIILYKLDARISEFYFPKNFFNE